MILNLKNWAAFFVAFLLSINLLSAINKSYFLEIDPSVKTVKSGHFNAKTKQIAVIDSLFHSSNLDNQAAYFLEKCKRATGKIDPCVLIFIHGMWGNKPRYLNDNALDFEADYANEGQNDIIIHLIWQGDALMYRKNERQAVASVEQIAAILNGFLSVKSVHLKLMCHSMGNFLFTKTIDKLNGNGQAFDKILLLAPDVDAAFFATQLPKLKTLTAEIDIFYHRKDLFLRYSAFIHKGKRLGQLADNQSITQIKTFDCTAFRNTSIAGKFSRHLYFKTSIETRKIIRSLM
jgi:esterase/lipase superfamily enzyme